MRKPFAIKVRVPPGRRDWGTWRRYKTEKDADKALKVLRRKWTGIAEFKKKKPPVAGTEG